MSELSDIALKMAGIWAVGIALPGACYYSHMNGHTPTEFDNLADLLVSIPNYFTNSNISFAQIASVATVISIPIAAGYIGKLMFGAEKKDSQ